MATTTIEMVELLNEMSKEQSVKNFINDEAKIIIEKAVIETTKKGLPGLASELIGFMLSETALYQSRVSTLTHDLEKCITACSNAVIKRCDESLNNQ